MFTIKNKIQQLSFIYQMRKWPDRGSELVPGVNDTWNEFQKFHNGKVVTSADWRAAKQALHAEYTAYLEGGGKPNIPVHQENRS
jgi:hypothetical protein